MTTPTERLRHQMRRQLKERFDRERRNRRKVRAPRPARRLTHDEVFAELIDYTQPE